MNKALFLDRDGVLNEDPGFLHKIEDLNFFPGIIDILSELSRTDYKIIIVTNQLGIVRGYYRRGIPGFRRRRAQIEKECRGGTAPVETNVHIVFMKEKFKNIKLIVFDFDGVMTDNRVLVFQDGSEAVFCNRSDGLGIELLREAGYRMLILSTETNSVVKARADKLKLEVIHGSKDKKSSLMEYCALNGIPLSRVCYVGNDINDLDVMNSVALKIAPADAHESVLNIANIVTEAKGGGGVIRELADLLCLNITRSEKEKGIYHES